MKLSGRLVLSDQVADVTIRGGTVAQVRPAEEEPRELYLSPGFIDAQVNGYRGIDYSAADLTEGQPAEMVRLLAPSGTTRHFPTIITNPRERIVRNLRTIAAAIRNTEGLDYHLPGIHVEGPFIAAEDGPRGAHDRSFVRDPSIEEFEEWQEAAGGRIRLVTLAPERRGALELIEYLAGRGVTAAIGHTAADPARIREAVEAGARCSTHLGNGSHALVPRLRNYIWAQLAEDRLAAGMIADGHHLPEEVIRVIARAKGASRIVLVSDVAFMGGFEPGRYRWGGIETEVHADGHLGLAGTEYLAGAGHLLDHDLAVFLRATGLGLREAVAACTVNPTDLYGLDRGALEIAPGRPADLVQFAWKPGEETLRVRQVFGGGRHLYGEGTGDPVPGAPRRLGPR